MSNDTKTLTGTVVDGRPGYVNANGQVYATPVSAKRIDARVQRTKAKGWTVGWTVGA